MSSRENGGVDVVQFRPVFCSVSAGTRVLLVCSSQWKKVGRGWPLVHSNRQSSKVRFGFWHQQSECSFDDVQLRCGIYPLLHKVE